MFMTLLADEPLHGTVRFAWLKLAVNKKLGQPTWLSASAKQQLVRET